MSKSIISNVIVLMAAIWLTACGPSAGDDAAHAAKENELQKNVADALTRAKTAEAALAAAKADSAHQLADANRKIAELQAKVDDFNDKLAAADKSVEDTQYVVVKKTSTPGTLMQTDPKNHPNDYSRTPSVFEIVFKGVQSGKEYPPLEVQELAFANFREGQTCTREDVARAKQ
jgi:hypothetical protein